LVNTKIILEIQKKCNFCDEAEELASDIADFD